ncbi:minichromosome maintenance domain-containing protein 2 isoform X2 [Denticeps clupeoides]|uniref:minichromosome maintenance domain-containing protein 2 isoform X2 n=1 Tax=Denticeps clupeoides TaxID=299321 RepID=UPI0010A52ED4|nr:minichromosome maintenance domain-containing protein 2 isoform X2 [Denticeps clupeoides]
MSEVLALQEAAVSYLDRSGGLLRLIEECRSFEGSPQNEAIYRFRFLINPSDLIDVSPALADRVLRDPLAATALFKSVCFLTIKTLSLMDQVQTENQVSVVLKLTHLPPFPNYQLNLDEFPRSDGHMRPLAMEGLVIAMTRVTKYTQGARFLCTDENCPCAEGFYHIRVHMPGATESATVGGDFSCLLCFSPLKEDVKSRVLGDKQLAELIDFKALDVLGVQPLSSLRYQSVTLFLRDELCNSMRIGQRYHVVGIPAHVHQWPSITWSIEASSIQPWIAERPSRVSKNFQVLHTANACSPWRFSAIVANCFASQVVPPGLYNTLKLVLLMSLAQTGEKDADARHCLDVLALTTDTLIADRLMTYGLGFAERGVRHQAVGELLASVSRDERGAGTANIHAGSALLATGGICLLGDLSKYRKDKIDALQSSMESRAVSVFIPGKKYGEDADQQLSLPLHCNFWAVAGSAVPAKKFARFDSAVLGSVEVASIPYQVPESFGLVVQCREALEDYPLLPQVAHALKQAVQPREPLYPASMQFSTQDYKEVGSGNGPGKTLLRVSLLAHAQGLQVELRPEAERIIQGYYMASRRLRSDIAQCSSVSATSIKLLIALAEAHSKLSLRTQVLEEDAVIAVLLCENAITLKHGASALVIPPSAVFPCDLRDLDSLHRRDLALKQLHRQILQFVFTYAPAGSSNIIEE